MHARTAASNKVCNLLLHKSELGHVIREQQTVILEKGKFNSNTRRATCQQNLMSPVQSAWTVVGQNAFPLMDKMGVCLVHFAVQSENVERVCKSRRLIHAKVRNRLTNESAQMLSFCHVNLCLLVKKKHAPTQFLLSMIENEEMQDFDSDGESDSDDNCDQENLEVDQAVHGPSNDSSLSSDEEQSSLSADKEQLEDPILMGQVF